MAEQNQSKNLNVDGYSFLNEEDARRAESEKKRIKLIEEKLDYSNPETILVIYKKAIQERVFKTPIGVAYLRKLQMFLVKSGIDTNEIPMIPIYVTFESTLYKKPVPTRPRVQLEKKEESKPQALPLSIIINIALVISIIAMFVITLNSNQPNILNYERVLTDRYAGWEQELTEREQVIKEQERRLSIENE